MDIGMERAINLREKGNEAVRNGEFYEALDCFQSALRICRIGGFDTEITKNLYEIGKAWFLLGRLDDAVLSLEDASKKAKQTRQPDLHGYICLELANVLLASGQYDRSLSLSGESLRIADELRNLDLSVKSLNAKGLVFAHRGEYGEAIANFQKALDLARAAALSGDIVISFTNMANAHLCQKDYLQAKQMFMAAMEENSRSDGVFRDLGLCEVLLKTSDFVELASQLKDMSPKRFDSDLYRFQHYTLQGLALERTGRYVEASKILLRAVILAEDLRNLVPLSERMGFFEKGFEGGFARAYKGLIAALCHLSITNEENRSDLSPYGRDFAAQAFYFSEATKARALLDAIGRGMGEIQIKDIGWDLRHRENDLGNRLAAIENLKDTSLRLGEEAYHALEKRKFQLVEESGRLVSDFRKKHPRYAALKYPRPLQSHEIPLKQNELLIEFCITSTASYLFRVAPGGKTDVYRLSIGEVALKKELASLLAPFRKTEGALRRNDLASYSVRKAEILYQQLLSPALAGVSPGTRLIIVPDGILGAFPLETLVIEAGRDWDDSVLVADRWSITYSQSAAVLALNRLLKEPRALQPLLAIGDCIYDEKGPGYQSSKAMKVNAGKTRYAGMEDGFETGAQGKLWEGAVFNPLPETRDTIIQLAALHRVKPQAPWILLNSLATETNFRLTSLEDYRYLFFGTHGFLSGRLQGLRQPVLVLSLVGNKAPDDGYLTMTEVLGLNLDADLVTLAACMTGVGEVMQGEGVLNFARAFQQAGARSVMAALWNIPVRESMDFYLAFYRELNQGNGKVEALNAARTAIRAKEAHPYFWGGIILHGEG